MFPSSGPMPRLFSSSFSEFPFLRPARVVTVRDQWITRKRINGHGHWHEDVLRGSCTCTLT
jgi:hypothetical protein